MTTHAIPFERVRVSEPFIVEKQLYVKQDDVSALDGKLEQRLFDADADVLLLAEKIE